jgi:hypothetical protein
MIRNSFIGLLRHQAPFFSGAGTGGTTFGPYTDIILIHNFTFAMAARTHPAGPAVELTVAPFFAAFEFVCHV